MTKILDTNYINCPVPKYIELRKGVLINGQYHLKDTMQPVPFSQYIYNELTFVNAVKYTFLDKSINYADALATRSKYIDSLICYDSENENISYMAYNSSNVTKLIRIDESNNKCVFTNVISISADIEMYPIQIEERDGDLILIYGRSSGSLYFNRLNKKTLTRIDVVNVIAELSGSYIWGRHSMVANRLWATTLSGRIDYMYLSPSTNNPVINSIANVGTTSSLFNIYYHTPYKETDNEIKVLTPSPSATGFIKDFVLSTFNKDTETWKNKTIVIDGASVSSTTNILVSYTIDHDIFFKDINDKTYIFIYERVANIGASKVIVYEISGDTDNEVIKFVKVQNMPAGQGGSIIHYKEDDKLSFYGSCKNGTAAITDVFSSVYCYELNETTLEFEKTLSIDGLIRDFGFDKERNLFITWADFSMDKYNTRTVANFNAKFEEGLYEYQGVDINTNLIVSTANLQGELLAKEVKLEMKGNAKFKSTDNKSISVTTLTTGDLKIPVVITGAGSLNIFPKVKA